jgi:hypothetical protein
MRLLLSAAVFAFALALVLPARADDTTAPVIVHTPLATAAKGPLKITAKITDESKFFPQVFYRYGGQREYDKPLDMKKVRGTKDQYEATIPFKADAVEYYLEAYDEFGNGPARAGTPEAPNKVDASGGESAPVAEEKLGAAEVAATNPPPSIAPSTATAAAVASGSARPLAVSRAAATPGSGGRLWTWVAGGTGLGLLAGGVVAGLAFKSADDAYKKSASAPQANADALRAQYDANKSLGTKATILTIAGGVLLAGGAALYFLEPSFAPQDKSDALYGTREPRAPTPGVAALAALPVDGGGAFSVAGYF